MQAYPIKTKQTATMPISEVTLKKRGFKPGGKYQVLITRLINGKEGSTPAPPSSWQARRPSPALAGWGFAERWRDGETRQAGGAG